MTSYWRLSVAGFAATAVTYGPARMGFGLFLPEFRPAFSISTQAVGLVSSLGFLGFLAGLLIAQSILSRKGPRLPVVLGLIAATVGMGTVAAAPNLPILSIGVFLAMSSAGFSWAPFNNAVHRTVKDEWRPSALSAISTGTGLGIVGAGAAALAMSIGGISWRLCWAVFAIVGAVAVLGNWTALRSVAGTPGAAPVQGWSVLFRPVAVPLFVIGLSHGTTSAIYISFAADHFVQVGGVAGLPASAAPALVFICYGLFGLVGLCTGGAKAALGLHSLLRLLLLTAAVSLALVALAPKSWAGLVLSAGLQGVNVMMMSALLAFWSERLFPTLPSQSFTAALLAVAAGSVLGPAGAGFASEAFGAEAMFLAAAAIPALTAAAVRAQYLRERAEDGMATSTPEASS